MDSFLGFRVISLFYFVKKNYLEVIRIMWEKFKLAFETILTALNINKVLLELENNKKINVLSAFLLVIGAFFGFYFYFNLSVILSMLLGLLWGALVKESIDISVYMLIFLTYYREKFISTGNSNFTPKPEALKRKSFKKVAILFGIYVALIVALYFITTIFFI